MAALSLFLYLATQANTWNGSRTLTSWIFQEATTVVQYLIMVQGVDGNEWLSNVHSLSPYNECLYKDYKKPYAFMDHVGVGVDVWNYISFWMFTVHTAILILHSFDKSSSVLQNQ